MNTLNDGFIYISLTYLTILEDFRQELPHRIVKLLSQYQNICICPGTESNRCVVAGTVKRHIGSGAFCRLKNSQANASSFVGG